MSKHRGTLRFAIDSDPDVDRPIPLEAVDQGRPWNGWRTPIVTAEQFIAWADANAEAHGVHTHAFVDSDQEYLTYVDLECQRVEQWSPVRTTNEVTGRRLPDDERVYELSGWVWVD